MQIRTDKLKKRFSASQIIEFMRCPRSWAISRFCVLEREQRAALEVGKAVHDLLEKHYKNEQSLQSSYDALFNFEGKMYQIGQIAFNMVVPFAPRPNAAADYGLGVEEYFEFEHNGITYNGLMDLNWKAHGVGVVLDHKTSSDPSKWGKKEEDLLTDIQRIIYSYCMMCKHPELNAVNFILNYGSTKNKPKTHYRVKYTANKQQIQDDFEILTDISGLMAEYVDAFNTCKSGTEVISLIEEIDKNPSACEAYGGCDYKKQGMCKLTTKERIRGLQMKETLVEKMKRLQLAQKEAQKEGDTEEEKPSKELPKKVKNEKKVPPVNPPEANEPPAETPKPEEKPETPPEPEKKTRKRRTKKEIEEANKLAEGAVEETKKEIAKEIAKDVVEEQLAADVATLRADILMLVGVTYAMPLKEMDEIRQRLTQFAKNL